MKSSFKNHFGIEATVVAKAPGRLEILGNHTDYNEGTVLSVAVDRAMTVAAAKVDGKTCELYDKHEGWRDNVRRKGSWRVPEDCAGHIF